MPYRPDDAAAAFLEGNDVVFGATGFKGFWDREGIAHDLGGELMVQGITETLTFPTAAALGLKKGSALTLDGTELRRVREVRPQGDGAISIAWLEKA